MAQNSSSGLSTRELALAAARPLTLLSSISRGQSLTQRVLCCCCRSQGPEGGVQLQGLLLSLPGKVWVLVLQRSRLWTLRDDGVTVEPALLSTAPPAA